MPKDMHAATPPLARRDGDRILFGDAPPLTLGERGDGWIDLAAPETADPGTGFDLALAAVEALTNRGGEAAIRLSGPGWAPLLPRLLETGAAFLIGDTPAVLPAAFWQVPDRWLGRAPAPWPTLWRPGPHGRHPVRPPKPRGTVYARHIPWLDQRFTLRAMTMEDLPTFHRWQNDPRVAEFFEESGTLAEHRAYLARMFADPHMLPLIGALDGRDFVYFELYWARENRIGAHYDAGAWDRGWHVLVGEADLRGADYVTAWMPSLMHYMFLAEPRTQAVVGEPKASHARQLANLGRCGFGHLRDFDFPHKRSALVRLERQHFFEARIWARPESGRGTPLALSPARLLVEGATR
ncbi:GNAT family N-acetyltransferase [Amaricoccus solimangrovi]|uniref:Acetyltransferase n=1 Tax=Amaricoccus solimangrovi TaxID=2589815 RepID=A0A501WLC0_9RHOB|nr:GNAT family N-acetyltransferase [Amaricoccus solimangrovi]TPE49572.1 acetyltransferase [Amaricoccus solimangrovi]